MEILFIKHFLIAKGDENLRGNFPPIPIFDHSSFDTLHFESALHSMSLWVGQKSRSWAFTELLIQPLVESA